MLIGEKMSRVTSYVLKRVILKAGESARNYALESSTFEMFSYLLMTTEMVLPLVYFVPL